MVVRDEERFALAEPVGESEVFTPQNLELDLSIARNNVLLSVSGNSIVAFSATDFVANVDVGVQDQVGSPLTFTQGVKAGFSKSFNRLFLSNLAQPGKILILKVGGSNLLLLSTQANSTDVTGSAVSITNSPTIAAITAAVGIGDIVDTIETDPIIGAELAGVIVSVDGTSNVLRTVPPGTIEHVFVFNIGANPVFIRLGVAATVSGFIVPAATGFDLKISGGAGGLSLNAIFAAAGPENVHVWALQIK